MIILMLLASIAHGAQSTVHPCAQAAAVYSEILPQVRDISITRQGDGCILVYEPKDGETIAFTARDAARRALLDELAAIEAKDDAGTALTAAEQRRFRKLILKLNGWNRRP